MKAKAKARRCKKHRLPAPCPRCWFDPQKHPEASWSGYLRGWEAVGQGLRRRGGGLSGGDFSR